jgi:hypothetical protein
MGFREIQVDVMGLCTNKKQEREES